MKKIIFVLPLLFVFAAEAKANFSLNCSVIADPMDERRAARTELQFSADPNDPSLEEYHDQEGNLIYKLISWPLLTESDAQYIATVRFPQRGDVAHDVIIMKLDQEGIIVAGAGMIIEPSLNGQAQNLFFQDSNVFIYCSN